MIHIAPGCRARAAAGPRLQEPPAAADPGRVPGATARAGSWNPGRSADGQRLPGGWSGPWAPRWRRRASLLRIRGGGAVRSRILHCGESGFCLRAAAAVAALGRKGFTLDGRGLPGHPAHGHGAGAAAAAGRPLRDPGRLRRRSPCRGPCRAAGPGWTAAPAASSSAACCWPCPGPRATASWRWRGLRSGPYVRMTLDVLAAFGARVEADPDSHRFPRPRRAGLPRPWTWRWKGTGPGRRSCWWPGPWPGRWRWTGLDPASAQADRAILQALAAAGARVAWEDGALRVARGELRAFEFDATDCPDLFPPLAVLACHARGTSRIAGVARLEPQGERPGHGPGVGTVGPGRAAAGAGRGHGDHRRAPAGRHRGPPQRPPHGHGLRGGGPADPGMV